MVIILFLLLGVRSECCLNCFSNSTSECLQCESGYFKSNFTCVSVCGYGYFINDTICDRGSDSIRFINTNFWSIFLYSLNEAGDFKTSDSLPLIEPGNMIPTYDRGFYSDSTSNLIGKSDWIPYTEITLQITFRPLVSEGIIFEGINIFNESFIKLSLASGYIQLEVLVLNQTNDLTQTVQIVNKYLSQASGQWFFIRIRFGQVSSETVRLDLELFQGIEKFYLSQAEMKITEMKQWVLGDINKINTTEGFYYSISASNKLLGGALVETQIPLCPVHYFENIIDYLCYPCQNCSSRLTCIDNSICSQCYSNQCSSCQGFMFGVCDTCNNTEAAPYCCPYLCRQCEDLSSCTRCHKGVYLYQGICINYEMYATLILTSEALINIKFDSGFRGSYDLFKTGEETFSYNFFNSPELVDPIPAKQRGLYFKGTSYLRNNVYMNFHPIFSVNLVARPTNVVNMTLLHVGGMFELQPFFNSFISYLQTEDSNRVSYYGDNITEYQDWVSLSLTVTYAYPFSIIKFYKDNIHIFTNSVMGIFRQSNSDIFIGFNSINIQSSGSYFIGFVYSFTYWNSEIFDFSEYLTLSSCLSQTDTFCLSDCQINEFLNNTGNCLNCSGACDLGCINDEYCNICQDRLCSICSDFYDDCITCTDNAGQEAGYCRCYNNSIDFNNTCLACDSSCGRCETLLINGCTECWEASEKLVGGICYSKCPNGFDTVGESCILNSGILLDLKFFEEYRFSNINDVAIGNSNNSEIDSDDPIPDPFRGYYFNPGKKMEKFEVLVFYEFSLSLWIKLYDEGDIITHGNLTLNSNLGLLCSQIPLSTGNFSLISTEILQIWTHLKIELDCNQNNVSTHSLYKSYNLIHSLTLPHNTFFIDSINSILIGGNLSFTGFIWMVILNNSVQTLIHSPLNSCIGSCTACTLEKICLSDCDFQRPADNCSDVCGPACLNCYTSSRCQRCSPEGILENGKCNCPDKFVWNNNFDNCYFPCFKTCVSCDTEFSGACFECNESYFLINNVCVKCPLGYGGDSCQWEKELGFHLLFDNINGIVVDKASSLEGSVGLTSSFYPEYDQRDPIFAKFRGFYFNSSYIHFQEETLLFAPELTIELWILPSNTSGLIFSKALGSTSLFQISLSSLVLHFGFLSHLQGFQEFFNNEKLSNKEWNYIQIFVKNVENINFQVSSQVNNRGKQIHKLIEKTYLNDEISEFFIGCMNDEDTECFNGFFYELRVFNRFVENYYEGCIGGCLVCSSGIECLANCSISSYWNGGDYFNCQDCDLGCQKGCKDDRKSCNLCSDDLCHTCNQTDFCVKCQSNSSINIKGLCECDKGYVNKSSYCEYCDKGYVYNNECIKCSEKCDVCGPEGCLNCTEHSQMVNGVCICNLGYTYKDKICSFVEFNVSVSISTENYIYLDFSHYLEKNLSSSDLKLSVNNKNINFVLSQFSGTRFVIKPKLDSTINNYLIGEIVFLRQIISVNNGVLVTNVLEFTFYKFKENEPNSIMKTFESVATKFASYGTYGVASVAMVNPTPASLWSFINSIQMIVYLYLLNIPFSDRFSGYLKGLKHYNMFPNFFVYLDVGYGMPHKIEKATDLGFKTNSVLLNNGQWISCFLFYIFMYYYMRCIGNILKNTRFNQSWLSNFFNNKCQGYKYGFFLRFWIQAYIEFLVGCFISLYSINLKTVDQALNFYFTLLLSFFIIITPIFSFSLGFVYKNTSQETQNPEVKVWNSLFYEFNNDKGAFKNQFYTIFFLRRFLFISFIFVFQGNPMIQICTTEILMIGMLLFIWYRKPFSEPALNYANLMTELAIAVIIPLIATFSWKLSGSVRNRIDIVLIVLINLVVVAQISASLYIFFKAIKTKLINRKKNQVLNYNEEKQEEEKERYRIQIKDLNINDEDEISFYSNHVYNTPAISARSSVLHDIFYRDDKPNLNLSEVISDARISKSNEAVEKVEIAK